MSDVLPDYNHEWHDPNKFKNGSEDNLYWLQIWKTQENYQRFKTIPELKRNTASWNFEGNKDMPSLVTYVKF